MDNSFIYHNRLSPAASPRTDDATWDKVLAAHKNKDYRSVITGILDYVDLDLAANSGNADRTQFDIPHGSISLQLNISDDKFHVEAPFLNIEGSKKIPLLRKVTELNFSPLNLSSIYLDGNQLSFRYSSPLSLCEPYRTYDALREICIYADSYDDEFITKFDANWIRQPEIQSYPAELKEKGWENLQQCIEEAKIGINYFETKRSFNLAWDVILITLMKIEFFLQPQGLLRTELEKMISYLTGSQDPMNEKVSRGKKYMAKLANYPKQDFEKDLYVSRTFIPYKVRSNSQTVRTNSENAYAQSKKEHEQSNHLGAAMTLLYHYYNMFYHNNVPEDISKTVQAALKASSGKSWHDASGHLFEALQQIMTTNSATSNGEENGGKKRGFFDKLFGKK